MRLGELFTFLVILFPSLFLGFESMQGIIINDAKI